MQNAPQQPTPVQKPDAPKASLFDRALANRREIALALLLTACALGFTVAAFLAQGGVGEVAAPMR